MKGLSYRAYDAPGWETGGERKIDERVIGSEPVILFEDRTELWALGCIVPRWFGDVPSPFGRRLAKIRVLELQAQNIALQHCIEKYSNPYNEPREVFTVARLFIQMEILECLRRRRFKTCD